MLCSSCEKLNMFDTIKPCLKCSSNLNMKNIFVICSVCSSREMKCSVCLKLVRSSPKQTPRCKTCGGE